MRAKYLLPHRRNTKNRLNLGQAEFRPTEDDARRGPRLNTKADLIESKDEPSGRVTLRGLHLP
ncbi:hypothetical protein [Stygiolobus caldivivus]|uniref:Uncharacterized protein n=1 Tax=Stygiolobus caldivivus TaxID=2824673 RepID=A0A8D5ZIW8_9CREN|nr:hypothetical protein [Stygiolobus caldivivus]BCU69765.1 hypothetical protein KN1_10620 [Stygiolobus caldivivus]